MGQVFLKPIIEVIVVSLEHGMCLRLSLQLGNLLVFESYQFQVSLYFFILVKELSYYFHIMFLVLIESMLPNYLSCLTMFKGIFIPNQPFAVLPISIPVSVHTHLIHHLTSLSCVSFMSMMGDTSRPSINESFPIEFITSSEN
jgi:hypothetical protein